jgi:Spy/CpxP family protein refolding chaperone
MNKNRFAKAVAVASGFLFLSAAPGLARAQSILPVAVQASNAARPVTQPKGNALPPSDFDGLNYTDAQKAELDRIHRETESRKEAVAKDRHLTEDQKDAMLLGYTRIEYGEAFKVLSPDQQKQVRQRLAARKASDQASQKKQPGRN